MRFLLKIYKNIFSPTLKLLFGGSGCRYSPTCSEYTVDVIEKYGIIKGVILASKRIASCNPWSNN